MGESCGEPDSIWKFHLLKFLGFLVTAWNIFRAPYIESSTMNIFVEKPSFLVKIYAKPSMQVVEVFRLLNFLLLQ